MVTVKCYMLIFFFSSGDEISPLPWIYLFNFSPIQYVREVYINASIFHIHFLNS